MCERASERARGGRYRGGERRQRRLRSAQGRRAGTDAAEPGDTAAAADSGHPSSPPPPSSSPSPPFFFLSFPAVLRGRSLSAARSRGVSATPVPAAAEGRAGPSPPQPGLRDPPLCPRLRPSPGLSGEGPAPAPARLPGGGLGEDVGRRRQQPGGGAAQTRRHHQPLEREPAGPVRDQRPHRGERPRRGPHLHPARRGPPRHPLRAAREVRHRARARPRPPPPRGQLGPPRRPPSRRPGGWGTGLPPLSANARPALAGEEAPLLGGEGRGGSVGPPLAVPGAARVKAGCSGRREEGSAGPEPSPSPSPSAGTCRPDPAGPAARGQETLWDLEVAKGGGRGRSYRS